MINKITTDILNLNKDGDSMFNSNLVVPSGLVLYIESLLDSSILQIKKILTQNPTQINSSGVSYHLKFAYRSNRFITFF
jgi:hypothetical protein